MALTKKDILGFLEKYKWIIFIVIISIYLANIEEITSPKKDAPFGGKPGTYKVIQYGGLAATIIALFKPAMKFLGPWGLAIGGALLLGPWLINNWINLFQPDPVIPSWIFIAGFIILALFVLKGQRRN